MKALIIHLLLLYSFIGKGQTIAVINLDSVIAHHPLYEHNNFFNATERYFTPLSKPLEELANEIEYLVQAYNYSDLTDYDLVEQETDSLFDLYGELQEKIDSFYYAYETAYSDLFISDDIIIEITQQQGIDYLIPTDRLLYYDSSNVKDITPLISNILDHKSITDYQDIIDQLHYEHIARFYQFAYPDDFNNYLNFLKLLCPIYLPF